MPNLGTILKSEIARLARKELRAEVGALKKAASTHRSEIAALKRRTQQLERELRRLRRGGTAAPADDAPAGEDGRSLRFSAKGLASQRKRLGLSAHEVGLLVGASSQSVYNWEQSKARPRAQHMPALAALRSLGKKDARRLIEQRSAA
jgi:DNA-binding XRE family transcriptional regulator